MFPRRASLNRVLFVLTSCIFCIWIWMLQPPQDTTAVERRDDVNFQIQQASLFSQVKEVLDKSHESLMSQGNESLMSQGNESLMSQGNESRTAAIPPTSSPQIMHKGSSELHNLTLEHLKQNMTMLKANMSGIGHIIRSINETVDHARIDIPNPHPFKYLINTETVCRNQDMFILAYIHTAPDHYKRRMVIRQTWGNPKYYNDITIRVIFVMGKTDGKKDIQDALEFEAEQYHDIVQEDFLDAYRNLTYKGIAALKWISDYCPHAKFILKTDDDIFVNTFTLIRHLKSIDRSEIDNKGLLLCLVWGRMKVMREGKWKVDREDFKEDFYPTYCSGSAFTMSTDVAIAMHNISYHVPFFWVDDFYITGLLPLKLGNIKHKQFMSTYVLNGKQLEEKFTGPQWFTYIFSHVHDLNANQAVWQKLVKLARGEHKLSVKYALAGQLPNEAEFLRKKKEEEEKKLQEHRKKVEQEKKKVEEKKKAEEKKQANEKKIAEEKKQTEETKQAEEKKIAEEKKQAEQNAEPKANEKT